MRRAYINKEAHPVTQDPSAKLVQQESAKSPWGSVVSVQIKSSKAGYVVTLNERWVVQGFFPFWGDADKAAKQAMVDFTKTWNTAEIVEAINGRR